MSAARSEPTGLTSIRVKLALSLFAAVAAFLGLDHALRIYRFGDTYDEFERARGHAQVERITDAIAEVQADLAERAASLGNGKAAAAELAAGDAPFDLVAEIDDQGNVLDVAVRRPGTGEPIELREFLQVQLSRRHPVMATWLSGTVPAGAMQTQEGPMVLGSHPLVDRRGGRLLVLGSFLTRDLVARTALDAEVTFELLEETTSLPPVVTSALTVAEAGAATVHEAEDGDLHAYGQLLDLRGLPLVFLRTPVERPDRAILEEREQFDLLSSIGIALLFPLALLLLIQAIVTGPLARLTDHAARIGASDDDGLRLKLDRKDEIGVLAREFDRMLDELERSRLEQKQTARFAGRADIAAGIMHSVGNLANSVSVSATLAKERADEIDIGDMEAIHREIVKHKDNLDLYLRTDPKGKHLISFFGSLTRRMAEQIQATRAENDAVMATVQQISDMMLALHQEDDHAGDLERVDLERELKSISGRIRHEGLGGLTFPGVVRTSLDPGLRAHIDRHAFVELIESLAVNAIEAMAELDPTSQALDIRLTDLGGGLAEVRVEDTGVGIEAEQLDEIFRQGSTSKANHVGLGLHQAAISARNMGGELRAESDGPGKGARLILQVPVTEDRMSLAG